MARIPLQPEARAIRALSFTVMALMVAVGIVALAGAATLRHVDEDWRRALAGRWTVELPVPAPDHPVSDSDAQQAATALRTIPGVVQARPIGGDEVRRLLKPWLGDGPAASELPLPRLIDLTLDPENPPERALVADRIAAAIPGARLDDHASWTRDLVRLARTGEGLGLALFGVIMLTIVLIVSATARARLAINRPEIELLHQIGASDGYIARQFQAGAFGSAALGALTGVAMAGIAGWVLIRAGRSFAPLLPELWLGPADWAALAAAPLGAVLLATLAARTTIFALMRRLK